MSGQSPRTRGILGPANALRAARPGILGIVLALSLTACGSAGVVQGPTETAAGGPGSPPAGIGTATLVWTSVTENTDGTALTTLEGYKVYYGTAPGALSQVVPLQDTGATSYLVTGLGSGNWYFAVTAYTHDGAESALSNIGQKAIP